MAEDGQGGGKRHQADVRYRPAERERRCGACVSFRLVGRQGDCERVEGPISPSACCDLWRPLKHGGRAGGGSETDPAVA